MEKLIKESFIYKLIIKLSLWLRKIFGESLFVNFFIKDNDKEKTQRESLLFNLFEKVINALRSFAFKIKLDKLFENSIFTKPIIWLWLLVFLTPFVPTMLALALLIVSALSLFLKILITKDFKFKHFKTNFWLIIFMIIILLAGFTSVSLIQSKKISLLLLAFVFSYFVIINTLENKKQFKWLIYAFAISGTLTALYGIYQYKFGTVYDLAWIDEDVFEDIRMRVYSTFENPNVYGEYLILVIPVITALLWTEKGIFKKVMFSGMLVATLLAAVLTFSRGCYLAIMLELAILLIIIDRRFILLGVIALIAMPFVLPETIINRFMSIGNMGDSSTSYRVYIWLGTIAMLKDYWVSGIGLGEASFNSVYPIYSYNAVTAPHSHNLFLQFTSEYGIIGLIAFLGVIYNFYKETIISMLRKKDLIVAAAIAGMTGFLLESLFDYTWYNYRVVLIFWFFIALALAKTKLEEDK